MLRSESKDESIATNSLERLQSVPADTVTLRLMDKLDEKDVKIEQLQTKLREKSEELAALKASHQHTHIRGYHDQPDTEGTHKGLDQ